LHGNCSVQNHTFHAKSKKSASSKSEKLNFHFFFGGKMF
jgi:hypothetical protein